MEKIGLVFKNVNEVLKFNKMSDTDKTDYYVDYVKSNIKIIGKEKTVYFYNYDSKLWQCDTREVYYSFVTHFLNQTAKNIKDLITKLKTDEDDDEDEVTNTKRQLQKLIKQCDTSAFINLVIDRSTGGLQDNEFVKKLDNNTELFPILDGKKINLRTKEITDRTRDDFFTFEAPVTYLKKTPNADIYFKGIMINKQNREYLRNVLGYCLTGDTTAQIFFIWYGSGSNGKSKLCNLLKKILGKFYHQCAESIFMKGGKSTIGAASPDKIALIGTRVAVHSEGDTADEIKLNESTIKEVTGEDDINARGLFQSPLNFRAQCKLSLLTNYVPPLDAQKAFVRRLRYIFFDTCYCANPKLANEVKEDDKFLKDCETMYLSEIFSWMVEGSFEYYKTKKIEMTDEFKERTEELLRSEDSIKSFCKTKLVITNNYDDYIRKKVLFQSYNTYCDKNSQRCKPRSTLFNRLSDMKISTRNLDGYDVYYGIKVTPDVEYKESYFDPTVDDDLERGVDKTNLSIPQNESKSYNALEAKYNALLEQIDNDKKIKQLQQINKLHKLYSGVQKERSDEYQSVFYMNEIAKLNKLHTLYTAVQKERKEQIQSVVNMVESSKEEEVIEFDELRDIFHI